MQQKMSYQNVICENKVVQVQEYVYIEVFCNASPYSQVWLTHNTQVKFMAVVSGKVIAKVPVFHLRSP